MDQNSTGRPHVVIVGGGFGGLEAARRLGKAPVEVTVIDRHNYHLFQPLLYQVATAALSPGEIAYPIRSVLRRQDNARVLMAEVTGVDVERRRVLLDHGQLDYDYLIVATGATHSYFGHDEWSEVAPGLKTVEDAIDIRKRVYLAYEAAEREIDPAQQREWLTFVVVGAGPTGVEMAGALTEIGLKTLARDFRRIDPTRVRVVLVEGMDRVLPPYPPDLSEKARQQLERRGVEVRLGSLVTGIDARGVEIGAERIPARTVLWAAGVQASPLARCLGAELDRAGRVLVEPGLNLPGRPEVFVIGDLAHVEDDTGQLVPGVAQGAIQGGRQAARNIRHALAGEPYQPFHYEDKGSLATVGRAAAIAHIGKAKLAGFFAWIIWWLVHVMFLIGFRNRVAVMLGWAWHYITWQRGARLITGDIPELPAVTTNPHAIALPPEAAAITLPSGNGGDQEPWPVPEERISEPTSEDARR